MEDEIINKVKCRLLISEPFFGHLLSSIDILPHDNIPKFMIHGKIIYFNKEYIKERPVEKLTNELLHCLMHIVFCHFLRKQNRKENTWNKSTDVAVNNILEYENHKSLDSGVTDSKYRNKSAEFIYEDYKLDEDNEGYGGGIDQHIEVEDRQAAEEVLNNVVEAEAMARSIGKMPAGMESLIKNLLKPKISWKELLRKFATECFMNEDYSFTNPRKCLIPYGVYCASLVNEADTLKELVIAVDTSGSIRDKELHEFFAEIRCLHYLSEKTKVITCDAAVHDVYTLNIFETIKDIKFRGRGGTDFRPVFEYVKEHKIHPTLLIYLTDMYGSFPDKEPNYPTIWVSTEKGQKAPFGNTIFMNGEN